MARTPSTSSTTPSPRWPTAVALDAPQLTALQAAVSSGAAGLEAAVLVGGTVDDALVSRADLGASARRQLDINIFDLNPKRIRN